MFIRSVLATNFKPFSELRVEQQQHFGIQDVPYYARGGLASSPGCVGGADPPWGEPQDRRGAAYVRTAQRVTVEFNIGNIVQPEDVLADPGSRRSIDLDTRVEQNYRRLVGESVQQVWDRGGSERTAGQIVDELVGAVHDPLARLLPDLEFEGSGDNPLSNGTFEFAKGTSRRYPYKLSGGEKAVFDVLLDFTAEQRVFANTVYCVDEPELHVKRADPRDAPRRDACASSRQLSARSGNALRGAAGTRSRHRSRNAGKRRVPGL